jgi:branched-chain amino acid transport system ATP-binding protein
MQLTVKDLQVSYGKKRVLDGISMAVAPQKRIAMVGHNGAGKTTLLKAILGILRPESGVIEFEGIDVTDEGPRHRVERGIVYCPPGGEVFRRLNVDENLEVVKHKIKDPKETQRNIDRVFDLFPALAYRRRLKAGVLSGGERQMLALGMSLMLEPKLFLIDEPSGGLSPLYVDKVFDAIRRINEEFGTTVVVVEQNLKHALELCEDVYVLRTGRMVYQGQRSEIQDVNAELLGF